MGLSDDRVIVKSSGEPTYRLPDMAYHREKFSRGYDILVDVFGSDHIATIPDVIAGLKALGYETDKIKVLIHQFVTLMENGEQVKMSKRTGKSYTLDDLLDEVGADVVRFFLIMRGISTHLEFDLDLAREQSEKNPVYYLQYAHARISSVLDNAIEKGIDNYDGADLGLLGSVYEINLIKKIIKFEETIENATAKCEPLILADYLRELAQAFHVFYHECRIIGSEEELMKARLTLARVSKTVLANGLKILGITAPDRM
jgi:arginyl-tRNA synthetase